VHADPLIDLGDRRDQRFRLAQRAAERPEGERRVLAAAPGEGEDDVRRRRGGGSLAIRSLRRPGLRLGQVSAYENLRDCGGRGPAAAAARTALPPRAGVRSAQSGRPGSYPTGGASQLRDSAGFAPDFAASAPAGDICPAMPSIRHHSDNAGMRAFAEPL
jgi:hypothetical protein